MQVRYQAAPRPDRGSKFNDKLRRRIPGDRSRLATQELEHVLELGADLTNDLLALARIGPRFVAHEPLAGPADREAFLVEQAANFADD